MTILVLGHKGMLGHMVRKYLLDQGCTVDIVENRYPSQEFKSKVTGYLGDYIINCIGAIPQRTSDFEINTELPIWLSNNTSVKVVHPGTDCEVDEDAYGLSKRAARDFITSSSTNIKILKASIIGPELDSGDSLLEWFRGSTGDVKGYGNAMWSGITTLEWAEQCFTLLNNWNNYSSETIIEGTCLSKYNLLYLIKEVFEVESNILLDTTVKVDKCIVGTIKALHTKEQLENLKKYYYNGSTKRILSGNRRSN